MRRVGAVCLAVAAACSNTPPDAIPTPAPTATQTATAPTTPASSAVPAAAVFDAGRAYRTVEALSVTIGPREDSDPRYGRAADLIDASFAGHGYAVSRQPVDLPAGTSAGRAVPATRTYNIIATPPGYDPSKPHFVAGAHLDTVYGTPGANDNASGIGVVVELARLARLAPTAMPVVWIAFGGEERRVRGDDGVLYGSRAYLQAMPIPERESLRGVFVFDVVGRGREVQACSDGTSGPVLLDAVVAAAARRGIPSRKRVLSKLFSDHRPFERAGYPVAWFYTGEFSQLHTPADRLSIVDRDALGRVGVVAWDVLRSLRR